MARTTTSDALNNVENKYELNLLAAQRVRDLNAGVPSVLPESKDRNTVRSLREIASGKLDIDGLRRELIQSYKKPSSKEFQEEKDIERTAEETQMLESFDAELAGGVAPVATTEEVEQVEEQADETQPVAE
ncbi:MAG: DNA-directed RNA polymerase subunit omega [Rickettsiales bacterium]|jgi:DNA-directed RNA polymerase subunit omega|nr:DNA-directed RNA polymerase subunit omega [Rickettsiales bacterium]